MSGFVRPPAFISGCLPTLKRTPSSGPNWIHEVKFDGWRVQLQSDGEHVRVYSRNGNDLIQRYFVHTTLSPCIIDAEVVADTSGGQHDFYDLLSKKPPLTSWCFDLLSLRGRFPCSNAVPSSRPCCPPGRSGSQRASMTPKHC